MNSIIESEFNDHIKIAKATKEILTNSIDSASKICINCLKSGNKILFIGNGGSAADAQHLAAEIVGRYKEERKGLAAIALTTDTSILTAIGNDFGYSQIFKRQVEALANEGDVLIGISTGGNSKNIVNAINLANEIGCKTIGFSGKDGGEFTSLCVVNLVVPSFETARIQEMHLFIGHTLCNLIDQAFSTN